MNGWLLSPLFQDGHIMICISPLMLVRAGAVIYEQENRCRKGNNLRGKIHEFQDYIQNHISSL